MELLAPLSIFIIFPAGALLIAAIYVRMYIKVKSKLSLLSALLWIGYSGYEYLMYSRVLCSGECNIRIDLLIIYPVLIVLSLLASVLYFRTKRSVGERKNEK